MAFQRDGEKSTLAEGAAWLEVPRLVLEEDLVAGAEVLGMEGQGHQENSRTGEPWEIRVLST